MIAEAPKNGGPHLVLVGIGNTSVVLARRSGDQQTATEHFQNSDLDAIGSRLVDLWNELPASDKRVLLVGSVCPGVLDRVVSLSQAAGISPILVVGKDLAPPMGADVREPDQVGIDRLCVAAGAFKRVQGACVVADFGTALTVDLVSDNGVFLGGTILPGLQLSARALHEHTELLPLVDVGPPTSMPGKDTESAIRNGVFAMMVGALREIAEQYATQIGKWPPLIVTGGDGELIASHCDFVDAVIPDLFLDGLTIAYCQATEMQSEVED